MSVRSWAGVAFSLFPVQALGEQGLERGEVISCSDCKAECRGGNSGVLKFPCPYAQYVFTFFKCYTTLGQDYTNCAYSCTHGGKASFCLLTHPYGSLEDWILYLQEAENHPGTPLKQLFWKTLTIKAKETAAAAALMMIHEAIQQILPCSIFQTFFWLSILEIVHNQCFECERRIMLSYKKTYMSFHAFESCQSVCLLMVSSKWLAQESRGSLFATFPLPQSYLFNVHSRISSHRLQLEHVSWSMINKMYVFNVFAISGHLQNQL